MGSGPGINFGYTATMKATHVSAALIGLAGLWMMPLSAQPPGPVDEATVYAEIRRLQPLAEPDAATRDWVTQWQDYRSRERVDLGENRHGLDAPRYPIAAAARATLRRWEIAARAAALQDSARPPTQRTHAADPTLTAAWIARLDASAPLPSAIRRAGPAHDWPEPLLLAIAAHPRADDAWTGALLDRAHSGASLRWLDRRWSTFPAALLTRAEANPALAESAWAEWARRANTGDRGAAARLRGMVRDQPEAPGLAAGLARWSAVDTLFGAVPAPTKMAGASLTETQRLQALVAHYQRLFEGQQP